MGMGRRMSVDGGNAVRQSAQRVEELIKERQEEAANRPKKFLQRFGCKFLVRIKYVHTVNGVTHNEFRFGVMNDKIRWPDLDKWVRKWLTLEGGPKLVIGYLLPDIGTPVEMKQASDLRDFIDEYWTAHPRELHVTTVLDMLEQSTEKHKVARQIFDSMDADGDGTLTIEEFKAAFTSVQDNLGDVSSKDLAAYSWVQFLAADSDRSGGIDFNEFVKWWNALQVFVKLTITSETKLEQAKTAVREKYVEAESDKRMISDILADGGNLLLDAKSHKPGVTLRFDAEACADEDVRSLRVHAKTLIPEKVAHFDDATRGAGCDGDIRVSRQDHHFNLPPQSSQPCLPAAAGTTTTWRRCPTSTRE